MAIVFFRTLIIFITLIVLMRLLGKRQMREMELSELVVSVLVADLASTPLQDTRIPLLYGLVPIVSLFACELLLSGLILSSIGLRKLVCGTPSFLIIDGAIQEREMRKARFSVDELMEELRGKDILDIATVQYAVLETDGTLSTILRPEERPVSLANMKIKAKDSGYPVLIIEDGVLLEQNLLRIGKDMDWLRCEIEKRGCRKIKDVFIMIFHREDKIHFFAKERQK